MKSRVDAHDLCEIVSIFRNLCTYFLVTTIITNSLFYNTVEKANSNALTKLLTIATLVLAGFLHSSFHVFEVEAFLGFNLVPNWSGDLVTFGEVYVHEGKIIDFKSTTPREFVLMATGNMRSSANPDKINMMELHHIPDCAARFDTTQEYHYIDCDVVDRLWKLRYRARPGEVVSEASVESGSAASGWARGPNGNAPTPGQRLILAQYGIQFYSNFAWGEQCFRLIHDASDASWVSRYIGS
ncbi:MAG: hypothetical protein KDC12_10460 [Flavobacteriales bacterium]|nr:hypothetical protein [Flavobacteriales bacterium]